MPWMLQYEVSWSHSCGLCTSILKRSIMTGLTKSWSLTERHWNCILFRDAIEALTLW